MKKWCEHIKWQDKSTGLSDFSLPGFYISEYENGESLFYAVPAVWKVCPICTEPRPIERRAG
jgi:hypothetical protein